MAKLLAILFLFEQGFPIINIHKSGWFEYLVIKFQVWLILLSEKSFYYSIEKTSLLKNIYSTSVFIYEGLVSSNWLGINWLRTLL